jgi:hypothetical protein
MDGAALRNRSFHDDLVFRLVFVGLNEISNAWVNQFANSALPLHFFALVAVPILFFLCFFSTLEQTAFVQDVREFCVIDLARIIVGVGTFLFAHDTLYQWFKPISAAGSKIVYVALWIRICWPCQHEGLDKYHNWPTFGPLGLWHKLRKTPWQLCPATQWQTVAVYVGLCVAGVVGYCLWRYDVKQVDIFNRVCQFAALAAIAKIAPTKAKHWWQAHMARIEAERIAKAEAEREASAAKAALERAAVEAERAEAEARRIIVQQAQQSVDVEAAKITAERLAQAAQAEIADLRTQLASMARIIEEQSATSANPLLPYLDRNANEFDPGIYLTWLALLERSKYLGKTKDRAKTAIFDTLTPIAMELGIKPKDRRRQNQPNRTLLESCIMAGLVGFSAEE